MRELNLKPELKFLERLARDEITPYDDNFFLRDQNFNLLKEHIKSVFDRLKEAVEDMSQGMFKWEEEIEPNSWQDDLRIICKFYNSLQEKQMVDMVEITGFKDCVTPGIIRVLVESSEELFENPERLCNLEIISAVFELWMRVYFIQHINYYPRIDSKHIQLMDPLMRNKIRELNRANKEFKQVFFDDMNFDIKKFCFTNLEKFFDMNKARALGGGLRRMRLNLLKIIKYLFELGIWQGKEIFKLLDLLHSKLQLLFNEENEFGDVYEPEQTEKGSAYDPFYHENIASIINHTTVLYTDELFKQCLTENREKDFDIQKHIEALTDKLYFNNKDKYNKINFLLFDGILYSLRSMYNEDGSENEKEVFASRTTFMNLFDIDNDLFILSTNALNSETITNYALVADKNKNAKNPDFQKISSTKKELTDILLEMRGGNVFQDPSVPFKFDNVTEHLIDPATLSDNLSEQGGGNTVPQSSFKQLKTVFEDLLNDTWFYNTNHKKEAMLRLSHLNFVYPILQLMDYLDRTPFKFRKKKVVNTLEGEDEEEDMEDVQLDEAENALRQKSFDDSEQLIAKLRENKNDPKAKLRIVKEKIKRGIKAQMTSIRSCVLRRIKSKNYPESAELISIGFQVLANLCKSSSENRAQLFGDDGWYHLERLYRKHPMRALLLFQSVFQNKTLLFQDTSIFNRIFNLYKSFCIKIFFKKNTGNIPVNDGVLIFLWNNVIADILKINTKVIPITKVMHMFLMIQQCFTEKVAEFTFTNIINIAGLELTEDARDIKFKFKMINKSMGTLLNLYTENEYLMGQDQAILCMEIAYSFLRLMNKATKQVYFGDTLTIARNYFFKITPDQSNLQHEWLFRFKEGLAIRSEITRFYRNFFVFHSNLLISPDSYQYPWGNEEYDDERLVPYSHTQATLDKDKKGGPKKGEEDDSESVSQIMNYMINGIKSSSAVTLTSGWWTKEDAEVYVMQYFVKNFFPTIYKYVMGVYKLYHFKREDYQRMADIVKEIATFLFKYTLKGFNKLKEQFPQDKNIGIINDGLDGTKKAFEEFQTATSLYKIETQELEEEEINKPQYYKWKRFCVIILSGIETIYENLGEARLIEKYRRIAYEKDSGPEMKQLVTSNDVNKKYSINLYNFEYRNNLIDLENEEVDISILGDGKIKAQVADMFRIKYIESKRNVLMLRSEIIHQFMNNSEGHHDISETFQNFIESQIKGIAPQLFNGFGNANGFFIDPFYYVLLRNFNNLLCDNEDVRETITHKLEESTDKEFNADTEPIMIMMQIIYKTYLDLYQFVEKKIFYDRNYKELWDFYFNIGDIIKNVCEKNNQPAKKFFNNFALAINTTQDSKGMDILDGAGDDMDRSYDFSSIKKGDQSEMISPLKIEPQSVIPNNLDLLRPISLIMESGVQEPEEPKNPFNLVFETGIIVHLKNELFKSLAYVGQNGRRPDIVRTDHPEMYFTIGRQFDILSEQINGPSRENQQALSNKTDDISAFNPRDIEIILNICRRNINDQNSGYIDIQGKAFVFLLAYFEGKHQDAIDMVADRLDPNIVFKLLINYTKRLYLQTKYDTPQEIKKLMLKNSLRDLLSQKGSKMVHYKKKKFDTDEDGGEGGENAGDKSSIVNTKSIAKITIKKENLGKNKVFTYGDAALGDMGADDSYNLWIQAPNTFKKFLEEVYKIGSTDELLNHYKECPEFCNHQGMGLIVSMYAVIKTMEMNFKFRGFMKKKIEEMKRHYYMLKNVSALCTNEEIDIFKAAEKEDIPEEITIFTFLNDIVRSVEIINSTEENTLAYYPMNPKVFFLTENSLANFRLECRIDQATTKVMDLMAYVKQFNIEMTVNYELSQKYNLLAKMLSDDAFGLFKIMLWLIGLQINIGVINVYEIIDGNLVASPGYEFQEVIIFCLSGLQLVWSFVIICLWFAFRYSSIREIEREKFMIQDPGVNPDTPFAALKIAVYDSVLSQPAPLNFILHFVFTILSKTVNPVFYGLHLVLIVNINTTCKFVIKSVTYRLPQQIWTFVLAVMFVYSYAILQVVYYRKYFGSDYPVGMCYSIYSCLLYSMDLGIRNGGGIADSMDLLELEDPNYFSKQFFGLSYFMLINIVSMNIIFGIIIDTFAELRDAQNTRDEDLKNVCFICGYERDVFEKQGKSFDKHVTHEHNPVNYINYLIYIRCKAEDEYDGIESYVSEQFNNKKTLWAPIENTQFIAVDKDEIDIDTKMDTLQERVDEETTNIKDGLTNVNDKIDSLVSEVKKVTDPEEVGSPSYVGR